MQQVVFADSTNRERWFAKVGLKWEPNQIFMSEHRSDVKNVAGESYRLIAVACGDKHNRNALVWEVWPELHLATDTSKE